MPSSRPAPVRPSPTACALCLIAVASSASYSTYSYSLHRVRRGFVALPVPRTELTSVKPLRRYDDLVRAPRRHERHRLRLPYCGSALAAYIDQQEGDGLSTGPRSNRIRGLLSDADFQRNQAVHETISSLRRQLPQLLTVPISFESGTADAYTVDTSIVVGGSNNNETKQICSSRKELVEVSQAMVAFVAAVSRTSRFLESALGGGGGGPFPAAEKRGVDSAKAANRPTVPFLDCRIVIDPNTILEGLRVDWSARWKAPSIPSGEESEVDDESDKSNAVPTSVVLKGSSLLFLNQDGKVRLHRIQHVSLNQQMLDAAAIGTFLSDVRGSVRNFQQSPIFGFLASAALGANKVENSGPGDDTSSTSAFPMNPFAPFLTQIDDVVQQVASAFVGPTESGRTKSTTDKAVLAPVYVVESVLDNPITNSSSMQDMLEDGRRVLRLQHDRAEAPYFARPGLNGSYPLPGTIAWSRYAKVHRLVTTFVNETVPVLADRPAHGTPDGIHPIPAMESLFNPDCTYCVRSTADSPRDGVKGNRTKSSASPASVPLLSTPRKLARLYETMASWRRRFFGSDWSLESVEVLDWRSGPLPRVRVRYRSRLVVPTSLGLSITTDTEVMVTGTDVYSINDQGRIVQVLQEELRINEGSLRDGQAFTRNLCSAIEAGSSLGDDWWSAGIARLIFGGESMGSASVGQLGSRDIISVAQDVPSWSDSAAATAFRLMDALVREVPLSLPSKASSASPSSRLPGAQYMLDDVRLIGYLNETLIRGRASYETSWNLAVASYTTALRTRRIEVASAKPVSARVEWTANRNIRLTADVRFVVKPVLGLPMSPPLPASDAVSFPLRLQVVSDYVLDPASGRVAVHRLVETRLNDQLAPGDVVARWIQQLTTMGSVGRWAGTDTGVQASDNAGKSPLGYVESSLLQWLRRSGSS